MDLSWVNCTVSNDLLLDSVRHSLSGCAGKNMSVIQVNPPSANNSTDELSRITFSVDPFDFAIRGA